MAKATRKSTNESTNPSGSTSQKTDPSKPTIKLLADFLLHLRDYKKFTVTTIKGYKSAIALALKTENTDVTNSPELTALVKARAAEIPPRETTPSKRNPTLVLETIIKEPSEPLETAPLKFLTHKCAFLLTLASAKRIRELQALSGKTAHREDWSLVFFDLAKDVLAKNELTSSTRNFIRTLQIPSLAQRRRTY